jgi:hypothetical protein
MGKFRGSIQGSINLAASPKSQLPKGRRIIPDLRSFLGSNCLSKAFVSAVERIQMEDL